MAEHLDSPPPPQKLDDAVVIVIDDDDETEDAIEQNEKHCKRGGKKGLKKGGRKGWKKGGKRGCKKGNRKNIRKEFWSAKKEYKAAGSEEERMELMLKFMNQFLENHGDWLSDEDKAKSDEFLAKQNSLFSQYKAAETDEERADLKAQLHENMMNARKDMKGRFMKGGKRNWKGYKRRGMFGKRRGKHNCKAKTNTNTNTTNDIKDI
mmetsp:Transcript_14589/g.18027  ORF Transcript_14589/g.18027 Transcript_14589/m.18027 type:complete len:207 (+) Transcript_14589:146-766(+)|eukprot:CAMPEP_0204845976 /NCGR_PEP_ID=MMETSP1347-20130617/1622_1 /ASSEMBLY_ACC=CAM_ASM_000690 /TAXON_ID=215587 /ORGANISM="Aplanochytrium stocchinoi, Strain GSBS06" /LENGTH=206 /DNA_ID=CAMNT_0051986325 /DNA_START=59 /DNA_END=679 /DNA_ORIENTATION=-